MKSIFAFVIMTCMCIHCEMYVCTHHEERAQSCCSSCSLIYRSHDFPFAYLPIASLRVLAMSLLPDERHARLCRRAQVSEWNLRKCSASGLDIIAGTLGGAILPHLLPELQALC